MSCRNIIGSLLVGALICAFIPFPVKKIIGHWASVKDMSFVGPGDTINFDKKKYTYQLYTAGLYHSGFEFKADTSFVEYHYVAKDADSSNVFYANEKYFITSDSVIEVMSYSRHLRFKVLAINSKKLSLKILP